MSPRSEDKMKLTPAQRKALAHMHKQGGRGYTGRGPGGAARRAMLMRLVEKGLVDNRGHGIWRLTRDGHALCEKLFESPETLNSPPYRLAQKLDSFSPGVLSTNLDMSRLVVKSNVPLNAFRYDGEPTAKDVVLAGEVVYILNVIRRDSADIAAVKNDEREHIRMHVHTVPPAAVCRCISPRVFDGRGRCLDCGYRASAHERGLA